jgi:hypothetical protein
VIGRGLKGEVREVSGQADIGDFIGATIRTLPFILRKG